MLEQLGPPPAQAEETAASSDFASFLAANGGANLNAQQKDALFRQFVQWQRQRQAQPAH
jgi:hypothetical protein